MSRISGPRLAAGRLGGRRLDVAYGIRPSSAKLREALFSIWGERVADAAVLDLFAGSGAIGLEAWSRGAAKVSFVESGRAAVATLRRNLALVADRGAARLLAEGASAALERLRREGECFDLLFADPPYDQVPDRDLLEALGRVASPTARLAVEHRSTVDLDAQPRGWRRTDVRRYGDSGLSLYDRTDG